ncbi:TetR family transcriptional regulator C-terminal domain-containing protein [Mesonia sp.]|uniref:TetR family transcriptional regulator C-terminal domain-containing protein n=1 Tax=Mesonia sp. TaxID=1960830 RepID=UPI003F9506DB
MEKKKSTPNKKTAPKKKVTKMTADKWISNFMEYVLEEEEIPKSVYKFAKNNNSSEEEFYQYFGSLEAIQKEIWNQFYVKSIHLMQASPEVDSFSSKDKMLTFFFTFFEMLTANRSYVLFMLNRNESTLKNLEQLKGLRKNVKDFAKGLIADDNSEKNIKILQKNKTVFSEGAWLQTMFLLKFWMDDNSPQFEKTDVAIEKSVNTIFDVFDNTPLEGILDFGKFLFKEKMA